MPASILILGGASAIGASAIQLLRLAYPSLDILATSSPKHHAHLVSLGATHLFDYHSSTVVPDIKKASPGTKGVDMIIDCVSAGITQQDICDVLDEDGSKMYASVITAIDSPVVAQGVTKTLINGWLLTDLQGGKQIIPMITRLVEEGQYKVPLPVRVVGHGLGDLPKVMDQVFNVSGEKLLVVL
jgi:NADPH:quinone reductase-like Zn-dependent oxidoreductase